MGAHRAAVGIVREERRASRMLFALPLLCVHRHASRTPGIGPPYYRAAVDEWENSNSRYGTFDQGSNIWEWDEAIISNSFRGFRGGAFTAGVDSYTQAAMRNLASPTSETEYSGSRVAQVPEPATLGLLVLGASALLWRRAS